MGGEDLDGTGENARTNCVSTRHVLQAEYRYPRLGDQLSLFSLSSMEEATDLSPLFLDLTPGATAEAKAIGLKVLPWTVNERADMDRLIRDGVDGIITDYPDRLRAALAEAGRPLPPQVPARP